jgi:type III secretion protein L
MDVLIDRTGLRVLTDGPIVKAALGSAADAASALLQAAETQARRLQQEARTEAERLARQALAEARCQAQAELAERLVALRIEREQWLQQRVPHLAGLVAASLRLVLQQEPPTALFRQALDELESGLRERSEVVLFVNGAELAAAREFIEARAKTHPPSHWVCGARVEPDADLAPGECVVRSAFGSVAVSLPAMLTALERAWMSLLAHDAPVIGTREDAQRDPGTP